MLRFKQGAGDEPHLKYGGAAHVAWELVVEVTKEITKFPGVGLVVWLGSKVAKYAGEQFKNSAMGKWLATKAGNEDFINLLGYDAQDIYPLLAKRLGQDLEEQLPARDGKACQAVVFLDTFEAFRVGNLGDSQQYAREQWVRDVFLNLTNVLLVLAGRDRLTWDEADGDWADPATWCSTCWAGCRGTTRKASWRNAASRRWSSERPS